MVATCVDHYEVMMARCVFFFDMRMLRSRIRVQGTECVDKMIRMFWNPGWGNSLIFSNLKKTR